MQKVNVQKKLASFAEYWSPKVVAELNGQQVKVAKLLGEFEWHFHEQEDELFWVIEGCLEIHLRDKVIELHPESCSLFPVALSTNRSPEKSARLFCLNRRERSIRVILSMTTQSLNPK